MHTFEERKNQFTFKNSFGIERRFDSILAADKRVYYKQQMAEENMALLADSRLQPLQFPQHVLKIIMDFININLLRD